MTKMIYVFYVHFNPTEIALSHVLAAFDVPILSSWPIADSILPRPLTPFLPHYLLFCSSTNFHRIVKIYFSQSAVLKFFLFTDVGIEKRRNIQWTSYSMRYIYEHNIKRGYPNEQGNGRAHVSPFFDCRRMVGENQVMTIRSMLHCVLTI